MYLYFDKQGNLREILNDQDNQFINFYFENITDGEEIFISNVPDFKSNVEQIVFTATEKNFISEIPYNRDKDLKFFKYFKKYKFRQFDITQFTQFGVTGNLKLKIELKESIANENIISTNYIVIHSNGKVITKDTLIDYNNYNELIKKVSKFRKEKKLCSCISTKTEL